MMKTNNMIVVVGSIKEAYGLVDNVTRWPEIVEDVGDVKVLGMDCDKKIVEISPRGKSRRGMVFVQESDPVEKRIRFRYISGIMKGVKTEWTFCEVKLNKKGLVEVGVKHDFNGVSRARAMLIDKFYLRQRTELMLARLKEIVEAGFLTKVLLLGEDFFNERMDWSSLDMLEDQPVVVKVY
jgi:ribosome-associated toxin RatA of RatAB toxin-antitoxin module